MSCEIVVRRARSSDDAARIAVVRRSYSSFQRDAFILFFFQELTLQCCVLAGAVLFIFCGVSARACVLLAPAAAAAVAAAVALTHHALADKHAQSIRKELMGFVAEYRGPLAGDPKALSPAIVIDDGALHAQPTTAVYSQVVGTVSVSEYWGPGDEGWMHALAVDTKWRRRGVGRALQEAARSGAAGGAVGGAAGGAGGGAAGGGGGGMRALHCVASELQPAARAMLHKAGWETRGWRHRRVCGAALTLLLAELAVPLAAPRPTPGETRGTTRGATHSTTPGATLRPTLGATRGTTLGTTHDTHATS